MNSIKENPKNKIFIKDLLLVLGLLDGSKRKLVGLVIVMVITSVADVISIGSIMPFLGYLSGTLTVISPETFNMLSELGNILGMTTMMIVTYLFCIGAVVAGICRIVLARLTSSYCFSIGAEISSKLYKKLISLPYVEYKKINSAEAISVLNDKVNILIHQAIGPAVNGLGGVIILAGIVLLLIILYPFVTSATFTMLVIIYVLIGFRLKNILRLNGETISNERSILIRNIQDSIGGIRDIILESNQFVYSMVYNNIVKKLRSAEADCIFYSTIPRYVIETFGIVFIALIANFSAGNADSNETIPTLGVLALSAQKMLPIVQQLYNSWANLRSSSASLHDVISYMKRREVPGSVNNNIVSAFKNKIVFDNVCFDYGGRKIIKDFNFELKKGEHVAIIGKSGSGKSTVLDLLMGLLKPSSGKIIVDGQVLNETNVRSWMSQIAHVPQNIFIPDLSIRENITFGNDANQIDTNRLKNVVNSVGLDETIALMQNGFETRVGEMGSMLSGGQRQRIGIARALYKNSPVLILDESTSALDMSAELKVLNTVLKKCEDKTIVMVTHKDPKNFNFHKIINLDSYL